MIPHAVSIDEDIEKIASDENLERKIIQNETRLEFLSILDKENKIIVLCLMLGFKKKDAAQILGLSDKQISIRMRKIKVMGKVLLNNPL